ncbi:MAG: hypothetical protein HGA36_01205 [Candidatus Moranbacteria bacterium]|nr:hypothetical protein [Candidatus Moranbacteria bacterium]
MDNQTLLLTINAITIGALALSIIYTAGVVWRVEKELDISYKFFLAAIIFLLFAEVTNLYVSDNALIFTLAVKILRMLFTICFLSGVLLMRDIVRKIDGEK